MNKYVLIIVTFFSMGILTAQNDSVRDPGFGKHTIGINLTPMLRVDGISIQYRITQGKVHFRSRFDYKEDYYSHYPELIEINDSLLMKNWARGTSEFKLRLGFEKQLKWKKINAFVGADLIVGQERIRRYSGDLYYEYVMDPDGNPHIDYYPTVLFDIREVNYRKAGATGAMFPLVATNSSLILGADVSLGVEFYLTKRLNLTTQLTQPICTTSRDSQGFLRFKALPSLDINLSYKFGGIKK